MMNEWLQNLSLVLSGVCHVGIFGGEGTEYLSHDKGIMKIEKYRSILQKYYTICLTHNCKIFAFKQETVSKGY